MLEETARLKANASSDSQSSSKPLSSNIHKRSEKGKASDTPEPEGKRKPGGQPGHAGKRVKGVVE